MTEERREIVQKYVHDMINSFVEDPHSANYHDEYNPPYVSFYSPNIERLLEKACHNDRYSVKHPHLGMLYDFDPNIYDIEGHRVRTSNDLIVISIDGVAFDHLEYDHWQGYAKRSCCPQVNRFHVRLPPKTSKTQLFSLWSTSIPYEGGTAFLSLRFPLQFDDGYLEMSADVENSVSVIILSKAVILLSL